jgi:hypothetical protein
VKEKCCLFNAVPGVYYEYHWDLNGFKVDDDDDFPTVNGAIQ